MNRSARGDLSLITGLHAKRWTREQAIAYGIEASEVERYVLGAGALPLDPGGLRRRPPSTAAWRAPRPPCRSRDALDAISNIEKYTAGQRSARAEGSMTDTPAGAGSKGESDDIDKTDPQAIAGGSTSFITSRLLAVGSRHEAGRIACPAFCFLVAIIAVRFGEVLCVES